MAHSRIAILLYSDNSTVRASAISALGSKMSPSSPENEIHEFATAAALHAYIDARPAGDVADLIILDAEAVPEGGMGIARGLKDEVFQCPPVLLIVARADDAWLAAWSRAEAVVVHPIDPFTFVHTAASLVAPLKDRSQSQFA